MLLTEYPVTKSQTGTLGFEFLMERFLFIIFAFKLPETISHICNVPQQMGSN